MPFGGCEFIFDGTPSRDFGLMIYNIGVVNENGKFASTTDILEDRVSGRYTALHYGGKPTAALSFSFTFGLSPDILDSGKYLSRREMSRIADWLTGHEDYKYLEIIQPDMDIVRYKCIITSLEYISNGGEPFAFECEVTCDSPYAYLCPKLLTYNVNGEAEASLFNQSSCRYYYPKLTIRLNGGDSIVITNKSDNSAEFRLTNIPSGVKEIFIDNENEIISSPGGENLYNSFNFKFIRLVRGKNTLKLSGSAEIQFLCEFPVNIGG